MPAPGPRDVLIKDQYCGVDGHDLAVRRGIMRRTFKPGIILGHEVSGTVAEVGGLVSTVKPGDRVCNRTSLPCGLCRYCSMGEDTLCLSRSFADGGLAEYVVYPEGSVIPVPDGVDMVDAAVSACAIATPYHALSEVAQVRPEEIVLVTGAVGGLGIHTIQLVHLFGARAIGWTRSESKRAALESVGVDELICGTGDATPVWQQLLDLTMGWGVDVVIDYVGSAAFSDAFRGMAPLGRYVILGEMLGEEIHINPAFIFFKRAKILGSGPHMRSDVYRVLEFVRRGKIKPIIGGVYSLEQISEVHALLDEGAITGRMVSPTAIRLRSPVSAS